MGFARCHLTALLLALAFISFKLAPLEAAWMSILF